MTYKLILLRHGQSEWNAKNLFTGWVDVPLSDQGRQEAVHGGELMKPYLIDSIVSSDGETVKTTEPESYKQLMTTNEANILGKLMKGVVENGTASALNGRGYTVAGKTGSAEFDENGSSHSWFIGYSNVDNPDLVVAIIVENGGTGSEAAVPIAGQIFDAYYYDN